MHNETEPFGLFLFDKPQGITSHDAAALLRRKLGIKRIGHAGTLDPMATGLLIMLLGKATKLQTKLQLSDKIYTGTFTFGIETDTWDSQGKITNRAINQAPLQPKAIFELCEKLSGDILQQVPPYSAVKYKGQRLYKLARSGQNVPLIMRKVNIKWLSQNILGPNLLAFKLKVSSGTYIRTIARDMGKLMGSYAHMSALRRNAIGKYRIEDAMSALDMQNASRQEVLERLIHA